MKRIQFFRTKGRAYLAILLGASLLTLCLILAFSTSQKTKAANTVLWTEVDPPATSGTFPSLVQGDVNEDGHIDLIAGSLGYGIGGVAGDGDGTWTPLSAIATLGTWYGLALGDVNNDGKLDLVGAEDGSGIHIWTGDGAGGWTAMAPPAVAGSFWNVALSDINNDGNLDIAAGSGGDAGLRVWTGDGAGGWVSISTGLPVAGDYTDVALGDVDRDGRPDLVAASHITGVRAWRWNGASWTERSSGLLPSGDYYGVALGDLDNDGDLDIVASGDGVGVRAWTVSVDITWNWSDASAGLPGIDDQYWDVGLSDVNNDGRLDIAATSYDDGIGVWLGNGGTAWGEQSTGLPISGSYYGLALGDWNDDGMVDLSAGQNAGVQAWVDDGTPEAMEGWHQIASPTTDDVHRGVDVGDFDRDGKLDVVAATVGDGLQLWTGDGGNTWTEVASWTVPDLPDTGTYHTPALVDIDNDGDLDVIVSRGTAGGIQVWRFLGPGWYEASTGLPGTGTFGDLDTGDFNNDGYVDFVAIGQGQGIKAWTGNGGIDWTSTADGLPGSATFYSVALGDVDRDGNLDLVAGSDGSGIGVWQGTGTGWSFQVLPTDEGSWWGIALGDVNDDGDLDIVAAADDDGVVVWAGDGSFGWTPLTANPAASGDFWGLDLGDYNNDGALDVAAGTRDNKGILVWAGDGGSSWVTYTTNLPVVGTYPAVRFGEIDNDGYLDLVGAKQGTGSIHAWTGAEGAPPSGWANFTPDGWIASRAPMTLSIEVLDSGSGLNPNSALYSTWEREGATWSWSSWKPADCTGSPGVTTTQTISAVGVFFTQDSGPAPHTHNQIRFRVSDVAGNTGYSGAYIVHIDTVPPTNPTSFPDSSPHLPGGAWEDETEVWVDWDGALDGTSGVEGYSYVFSKIYELPDTVRDTRFSDVTSDPLGDGEWYIYVRTQDKAGNWAPDAVYEGPFRIDTLPPTNPTGFDSHPHLLRRWSNINRIHIDWSGANDDGSGVWGYGYAWTTSSVTPPSSSMLWTTRNYTTSHPLDDGSSWYFHIRARDRAENWASEVEDWGPFYIDAADPYSCTITSPIETDSTSFPVEWSCDDALSGVSLHDVQVRDGEDGSWTDWLTSITSISATYTGAVHNNTYHFRVCAHDRAGNVSGYLDDAQTDVVEDLMVTGLEVTQAIQNLDNDVPLIADKGTYVRFYVRSRYVDVPDIDAWLCGSRDGEPLPGSPLAPAGGPITVRPSGGDRANLDDSFYFRLPRDWRSGTVELRAVVDPDHEVVESDYDDNEWRETVTFETSGDFCIVFVPVHLHPHTYHTDDAGFWDIVGLMKWMYPVREGGVGVWTTDTMYPEGHRSGWEYGIPDDFDRILGDLRGVDFWTEDPCHDTHYYGMVHPDSYPGSGASGMGERYDNLIADEAAGVMAISLGGGWPEPVGGATLAHELAHNFTRKHVWCTGCEEGGGEVDDGYPYEEPIRHTCKSTATYTCRIGLDSVNGYYGFWPNPGATPEVVPPVGTGDLMSYYYRRWPSDWTYRGLLSELRDLADMQAGDTSPALSPVWAQADEYLFAAGIISLTGQTTELDAFYRTSEPDPKFVARSYRQELEVAQSDSTYSLVLEDALGTVLYTHTFAVDPLTDGGLSPGTAIFAEVFPYDEQTARIVLKQGEMELASRWVSAHAPTVTLLSPNGGETISNHLTISWIGADEDGDDLRYTVQYSPDDGATWRALALNWIGISFDIDAKDLSTLPGSNQARIRVIATDGVNTAEDQSDAVFTLPRKSPQAHIVEPKSGGEFGWGSTVVLRGMSLDAEDGLLGDEAYTWTSNLSGTLGTGGELWVSDLPTGTHRITLTVTDSDGDTGTDEIIIFVGVSPNKVYLPLVQR
jgi:hypothetical protein